MSTSLSPAASRLVESTVVESTCDFGKAVVLGASALAVTALAGCNLNPLKKDAEDDGTAPFPTTTIATLSLKDMAGGTLTAGGVSGTPVVTFTLDGGNAGTSRAADPGPGIVARAYDFSVSGTGGSGTVGITINPEPVAVATALHPSLVVTRGKLNAMGFSPSWDELMSYAAMTHAQIVERMLGRINGTPHEAYPTWIDEPILSSAQYNTLSQDDKNAYNNQRYPRRQDFKAWFFRQMVTSPDPLTERLVQFWHGVFTSSASSLDDPQLIARQHRLYRLQFAGNLRDFLKAMARDAGMCEYLDSARNKKGKPNENFACELMELFTLGERATFGGYAESDIPLIALCFTGYGVDANKNFRFNPSDHDFNTPVTLWGSARPATSADGDWVIDKILVKVTDATHVNGAGHSFCAIYLVTRLWKEFVGEPSLNQTAIVALADQFSGVFAWDLKQLYRALFNRAEFSDPTRNGTRLRAPIELYVGYYRALGIAPAKWDENLWNFYTLDQDLLDPPNVFGWPGGTNWITVKTLVDRREYMSWIGWSYRDKVPERLANVLDILLLATDPIGVSPSGTSAADRSREYITDPAYNLR